MYQSCTHAAVFKHCTARGQDARTTEVSSRAERPTRPGATNPTHADRSRTRAAQSVTLGRGTTTFTTTVLGFWPSAIGTALRPRAVGRRTCFARRRRAVVSLTVALAVARRARTQVASKIGEEEEQWHSNRQSRQQLRRRWAALVRSIIRVVVARELHDRGISPARSQRYAVGCAVVQSQPRLGQTCWRECLRPRKRWRCGAMEQLPREHNKAVWLRRDP